MGVIPLILPYLIRPFHKVDHWHKTKALTCFVLQIIYCNICDFSRSTSYHLQQKKPQQIEVQLRGFQAIAYTYITASCYISTLVEFEATLA
jgi:hypothetical protein